jgi:hypothetical protein
MFGFASEECFPISNFEEETMTFKRRTPCFCGVLLVVLSMLLTAAHPFQGVAATKFSDWSAPVNLGALVNSGSSELAPHLSKNGLSLYFASDRTGSLGGEDLWVSHRNSEDEPWRLPMNLGAIINTPSTDRSPALSRDGHYLFFATDRSGGFGALDIWVSWRPQTHDDFGWQPPVNLGAGVNSAATDAGPNFFENDTVGMPQLFLASNRAGGPGGLDIYVSSLIGGTFQAPVPIAELNTAQNDLTPTIRHDGLEIIIASNRPGGAGSTDLWVATRNTVFDTWSAPVNLNSPVNSSSGESFPSLSSNRQYLFFNAVRPGGLGGSDLYVSSRSK